MAHPYSTFPDICKLDTGNFSTPTTSIQDDGWPDLSVPAAQHFNWFAHWTSKWINYLAGIVPDDLQAQITTNYDALDALFSAGVNPVYTQFSDVYLTSSDGASTPVQVKMRMLNIGYLVFVMWPTTKITLPTAGNHTVYLEKTSSNWLSSQIDQLDNVITPDYTQYPCGVVNAGYNCAGAIRPPLVLDRTDSFGKFHLCYNRLYNDGSNDYMITEPGNFRDEAGIQGGGIVYYTYPDTSGSWP